MRDNKKDTIEDREFEESFGTKAHPLNREQAKASELRQALLATFCASTNQHPGEVLATAAALLTDIIGYPQTLNFLREITQATEDFIKEEGITE
jgi:hypothetical protein